MTRTKRTRRKPRRSASRLRARRPPDASLVRRARGDRVLLHIYGVVPASAELPADLTGRGGHPVRLIDDEDLGVLVSDVDDEARVGRDDLLTHAHLLERLSETCTVIPSR